MAHFDVSVRACVCEYERVTLLCVSASVCYVCACV